MLNLTTVPSETLEKFSNLFAWTLWNRGSLKYYLYPYQQEVYNHFKRVIIEGGIFIANISRQFGKSTTANILCLECAVNNPNWKIIYGAPEKDQADAIFDQNATEILRLCPPWIDVKFNKVKKTITFGNGSVIRIVGLSNPQHRQRLRGKSCDLFIIDEGAFVDNLDTLISSIVRPMFNHTNAGVSRIIIASTPNDDPGHPFEKYVNESIRQQKYLTRTIHDTNKTPEEIEKIMDQYHIRDPSGNIIIHANDNPQFQREYLCSMTAQMDKLICPYWLEVKPWSIRSRSIQTEEEQKINFKNFGFPLNAYHRPAYYIPMVCVDYGWEDHTGVVFGFIDYSSDQRNKSKIVIIDELFYKNKLPAEIGHDINRVWMKLFPNYHIDEGKLWIDTGATGVDRIVTLRRESGLRFSKVNIRDKQSAITKFNTRVANSQLIIMDNCIQLINTMQKASWVFNRNGIRTKDFERTEELGHCDMLDALIAFNHHAPWNVEPTIHLGSDLNNKVIPRDIVEKMEKQQSVNVFADLKKRIAGR